MDRYFLVRHYSHMYIGVLIDSEGKYGYFTLIKMYQRHHSTRTYISSRGRLSSSIGSSGVDMTGDTIKKELKLVEEIDVDTATKATPDETTNTIITIASVIILIAVIIFVILISS